ncbi:polysaccharide biosynthesis protein [Oscillibacter sp.]|uniref:putative polysaccharide biosynthesis protein n=1 Tax=Oscillibacter sp. TaxID=1945593 RepID=UPI00261550AB|nr:polysaccharide biosynthesis protein [Oscillibacter sp.]MDD3347582.1 polysaccharide biosynthesis protein [Oscillibacter sp.]
MSKQKKQSFLGGAAILAAAVAIVKIIGAVYKIPFGNIVGSKGQTYFNVAYNIYNVLLTVSTAGLPLAISKLTSQAHAQGRENEKRKIFRTAIWLFFVLGLVGALLMYFGAAQLADFMNEPMGYWPIRTLAPAVFCVCLLACMRGYTQGQGNMTPTAVSQILEALCKLVLGLTLAWYFVKAGLGLDIAAAGAILGVTVGTIMSMLFLIFYLLRHQDRSHCLDVPSSSATLMKQVLTIGIPITLSNSAMSIITLVDTKIVLGRLRDIPALADSAATLFGQYQFGMNLINLPPSFVYPVTMSLIPFAAAAITRQDHAGAGRIVASAFRLIALLAIPAGVGLSVLGGPILLMLYPSQQVDAAAAGPHMRWLGIACIFICVMTLTNAILQTYGKEQLPIFTVIAGGATKIIMNYILVGNPDINIHGAPISTLCCYLVICGLNLFFVWKYSPEKPRYLQLFAKPILASALMGGSAWAVYGFVNRALHGHSAYGANALATMVGIGVGVVVYGILVIVLQILRAEDVRSVPHGEKLIHLLHLK